MLGFVIISKKKLKDIESDAYYRGFQVARSVGYSDPTPPSYGRVEHRGPYAASSCGVTRDNTQAANRAVQVMDKAVQESVTEVKKTGIKRRRYGSKGPYKVSKYSDPGIKLVNDGRQIESIIVSSMGEKTCDEIAAEINKTMGTHARGAFNPIKITGVFVSTVVRRHRVWDDKHGYFVNVTGH